MVYNVWTSRGLVCRGASMRETSFGEYRTQNTGHRSVEITNKDVKEGIQKWRRGKIKRIF
jgi:hypothetical protein